MVLPEDLCTGACRWGKMVRGITSASLGVKLSVRLIFGPAGGKVEWVHG